MPVMTWTVRTLICVIAAGIVFYVSVYAQSATATLSGSVVDENGAVIPGVNIAVINLARGFQRTATTSSDGNFVVPLLPPGKYIVKAEREDFATAEVRDVVLNVN